MSSSSLSSCRILQIAGTSVGGSWFYDQVTTLDSRGHEILAVLPGEGPLADRLRNANINVVIIPFKGSSIRDIPRLVRAQISLTMLVRNYKPDIVHSHLYKAVIMGRIAGFSGRAPVVVSQMPGSVHLDSLLLRTIDRGSLWIDEVTVGSCREIAERYRAIGAKRVAVSYYGCNVRGFDHLASGQVFRDEYHVPADSPTIGMIAYMYPSKIGAYQDVGIKGHEVFIDSAQRVLSRFPKAHFFVVGDELLGNGDYRKRLEDRASKMDLEDRIHFTGRRSDIPNIMAAMDVLVNPSLSESASYTMIEALLMQRGVVASDVGGLPDTVQHRETGLLVPPRDAEALALAIIELIENPQIRREMGALGRMRSIAKFDIDSTVDSLELIYSESLNRAR